MKPRVLLVLLLATFLALAAFASLHRESRSVAGLAVTHANNHDVQITIGRDLVADAKPVTYRVPAAPGQRVVILSDIDPHDLYISSDETPAVVIHEAGFASNPRPSFDVPAAGKGMVYVGYYGAVWTFKIEPGFIDVTTPNPDFIGYADNGAAIGHFAQYLARQPGITLAEVKAGIKEFEANSGLDVILRVNRPGEAMTMELRFGRINIMLDEVGDVTRITQG